MKEEKAQLIGKKFYQIYKQECPEALDWHKLNSDQKSGFIACAVHVAAVMDEQVRGSSNKRYVLK